MLHNSLVILFSFSILAFSVAFVRYSVMND